MFEDAATVMAAAMGPFVNPAAFVMLPRRSSKRRKSQPESR
jgi:hypothetical protein